MSRLLLLGSLLVTGCSGLMTVQSNALCDQTEQLLLARPEAVALPRETDKRLGETYRVEPGDVLLLQPNDYDSAVRLPGDQPILPDGSIQLGKYGRVLAAGRTLEEIEHLVREQLARAGEKEPPTVQARLITRQSKVYYVLGEVITPGAFVLTGRETVLDAILQAGGINDRGSQNRILLTRPTRPCEARIVLPVCYRDIVQLGDTSTNYQVQAGDRIFVPSRSLHETLLPFQSTRPCPPCARPQHAALLPTEPCVSGCGSERTGYGVAGPSVAPSPVPVPGSFGPSPLPTALPPTRPSTRPPERLRMPIQQNEPRTLTPEIRPENETSR